MITNTGCQTTWTCTRCGEAHESQFDSCWSCGTERGEDERILAEQQRQRERQLAEQQHALTLRLNGLVANAKQIAEALPKLAESAEKAVLLAEQEFDDGAFAPFWDAVEQAANQLASFDVTVRSLIESSQLYDVEASKSVATAASFQIGLDALPDASNIADQLRLLVRRAQKDFYFASIYEQRRANQLLVAGFSTLGHAIVELGDRLDASLDCLGSAISIGISDLSAGIADSHEQMSSSLSAELQRSRKQAASDAEDQRDHARVESQARRDHERKEREMLDNIQRRRKPMPPKL